MRPALLALPLLVACGGAGPGVGGGAATPGEAAPAAEAADRAPSAALERALRAYGGGDLQAARRHLGDALHEDPQDPRARELAAQVAAALGRDETALALLEGRPEPWLVRLAARLLLRAEHLATAASIVAPHVEGAGEVDPVLAAMLEVARAGAADDLYRPAGGERARLAFVEGVPLPVVEVAVGDERALALVATSADLLVVDAGSLGRLGAGPDGAAGGVLRGPLALGEVHVERVPFVARDLAPVAAQLGRPIRLAIGLDLLVRLRAAIDGPGQALVVHAPPADPALVEPGEGGADAAAGPPGAPAPGPPAPGATAPEGGEGTEGAEGAAPPAAPGATGGVPYVTFGGSHLAVRARLAPGVGGYVLIDTAGLFPIALVPEAVEALDVNASALPPAAGAPAEGVRVFALPEVTMGDVALEDVPVVTGLAPSDLGPAIGAPLAGLVGWSVLERFTVAFDPDARRLRVE